MFPFWKSDRNTSCNPALNRTVQNDRIHMKRCIGKKTGIGRRTHRLHPMKGSMIGMSTAAAHLISQTYLSIKWASEYDSNIILGNWNIIGHQAMNIVSWYDIVERGMHRCPLQEQDDSLYPRYRQTRDNSYTSINKRADLLNRRRILTTSFKWLSRDLIDLTTKQIILSLQLHYPCR